VKYAGTWASTSSTSLGGRPVRHCGGSIRDLRVHRALDRARHDHGAHPRQGQGLRQRDLPRHRQPVRELHHVPGPRLAADLVHVRDPYRQARRRRHPGAAAGRPRRRRAQ
jgi:hypothetical protein